MGQKSRRGTCILVNPNWAKYVEDYNRVLVKSRVQILRFNGLPCGDLGVINAYIVNNPTNKSKLVGTFER
jgi:hypothetical protein